MHARSALADWARVHKQFSGGSSVADRVLWSCLPVAHLSALQHAHNDENTRRPAQNRVVVTRTRAAPGPRKAHGRPAGAAGLRRRRPGRKALSPRAERGAAAPQQPARRAAGPVGLRPQGLSPLAAQWLPGASSVGLLGLRLAQWRVAERRARGSAARVFLRLSTVALSIWFVSYLYQGPLCNRRGRLNYTTRGWGIMQSSFSNKASRFRF